MARVVTEATLGAWLIKADPRVNRELLQPRGGREPTITSRCVTPGYRADLMRAGHPVALWVSGAGRGLRGLGHVTGAVARTDAELAVPVRIALWTAPLTDAELRAAGIDDLEVQRMPAGPNPSWVSREQWRRIAALLDERVEP